MNAKDVIKNTLDTSDMILGTYVGDLADADFLLRPVAGMNHIAWQLGHLIEVEHRFVESLKPGSCPKLPDGFAEHHKTDQAQSDDPAHFATKAAYLNLWKAQRAATKAVLDALSDAELDEAKPGLPPFAPTVGAVFNLLGTHPLMHAGQFVAVRRMLGKPVLI
jgi:uncharacterized damage-inducible protein DinB